MSNITAEWVSDAYGEHVLVARKNQGKISQKELAGFLCKAREYGLFISRLDVYECTDCENDNDEGDEVYLYYYVQDEPCPVCGRKAVPNYCVNCGHPIDLTADYYEPIEAIRGRIEISKPVYQLACACFTEGGFDMCACGIADSIEGIMRLMHDHVQTLISLDDEDPFFQIPAPAELPGTIEYEWDDARVKVIYEISGPPVLLQKQ